MVYAVGIRKFFISFPPPIPGSMRRKGGGHSTISEKNAGVLEEEDAGADGAQPRVPMTFYQAQAFLAMSTSCLKAASLLTASSESILRSIATPALFRPCIKVE